MANSALVLKGVLSSAMTNEEDSQLCALGPQALAAQLAMENRKSVLTALVTSLPKFMAKTTQIFQSTTEILAEKAIHQYQLQIPGPGDGSTITFRAEPGIDPNSGKVSMDFAMPNFNFPPGMTNSAGNSVFTVNIHLSILPDPVINTLKVSLSSPQVSTHLPGVSSFSYRIPIAAYICRPFFTSLMKVCLLFDGRLVLFEGTRHRESVAENSDLVAG